MYVIASIFGLLAFTFYYVSNNNVNVITNIFGTKEGSHKDRHIEIAKNYFNIVDIQSNCTKFAEIFSTDASFTIWHFPTSIGHVHISGGCQAIVSMVKSINHGSIRLSSIDRGMYIV
jgi:hypothetical protein